MTCLPPASLSQHSYTSTFTHQKSAFVSRNCRISVYLLWHYDILLRHWLPSFRHLGCSCLGLELAVPLRGLFGICRQARPWLGFRLVFPGSASLVLISPGFPPKHLSHHTDPHPPITGTITRSQDRRARIDKASNEIILPHSNLRMQ